MTYTPEQKQEAYAYMDLDYTDYKIAAIMQIPRVTIGRWRKKRNGPNVTTKNVTEQNVTKRYKLVPKKTIPETAPYIHSSSPSLLTSKNSLSSQTISIKEWSCKLENLWLIHFLVTGRTIRDNWSTSKMKCISALTILSKRKH